MIALKIAAIDDIENMRLTERKFEPTDNRQIYEEYYSEWKKAVERCIYDKK